MVFHEISEIRILSQACRRLNFREGQAEIRLQYRRWGVRRTYNRLRELALSIMDNEKPHC